MNDKDKTKEQLIIEFQKLQQEHNSLKISFEKVISGSKLAYEELRQSEELFSQFIKFSPIYAYIKEVAPTESRVLKASENYYNMIGIPGSEMVGRTMHELFPPEFAVKISADDWSVASSGQMIELDEELNGRNYTSIKFPINLGNRNLIAGYTIDFTERKQAETLFKDIIDKNPMSIQIVDQEGFTLETNSAYIQLFGILPPVDFSIFTDLKSKGMGDYILLAMNGEVAHLPDLYFNVHDIYPDFPDKPVWIRAVLFPLKDSNDQPHRFVFMHEDITERKLAEAKLKESEEKYRLIVENIGEGFAFVNVEEQFVLANKSAEMIFEGVEPGDLVGRNLYQFVSKDQFSKVQQETTIRKQGIQSIYELDILRPNGEKRTILVTAVSQKHKNGVFFGTYGIFRDITEKKCAEQEINLKNEQLIRLNAEKDKFFSIIAHDLRSPFNVFLGFTRLMAEELPSLTLEEIQKIALNLRNSANKLYSLLGNLLEWSQMQQGMLSYEPKAFNFLNEILPILDSVRDIAKNKMIAIGYDFPEDLRAVVDKNMFASLISNLLFNAIKFTPKNGIVTIAAKPIPGNSVEVSISDTGIGMNKDLLDKLFKLGEDMCRKGTDGEPSTGLGLLICKDYVEKHGGKIWAESEEGKGSTFYFTIPQDAGLGNEIEVKTAVSQKKETSPIKNLKILVAEDEEESDMFIQAVIKIFGKDILTAKNGIEALEICRNNPGIDLVLMDIQMPEMDGYEATRQIRLFNKELIIIAQTAYAQEGAREKAIAAGCNDYISKPIKKDELLALVQTYFKK